MLNKQGPGTIDWTDYSINYVSGLCKQGCHYCYMKRMYKRFKHNPEIRLNDKAFTCRFPQKPSKIFVGSSHDMFGDWVPDAWIKRIIAEVTKHPQHTFQFLTKNPKRYREFIFPENCWLGTTVDGTEKTLMNVVYLMAGRKPRFKDGKVMRNKMFVSFEPLLHEIDISFDGIDWLIIGADSNPGAKQPPMEWAKKVIHKARVLNIPVWMKDNYHYSKRIKEFPSIQ